MRQGRLTSVDLTAAYLQRIKRLDGRLNAVLEVNPLAQKEAAASDKQRRHHGARSALEGVPVLLKDNVDTTAQGATAGSRALLGGRPDDATIVRKLHEAGAVVIGKANLSEWANFRSDDVHQRLVGGRWADLERLRAGPQRRAAPRPARAPASRRPSPRSRSAPRPTARSCAPRPRTGSSG